MIVKWINAKSEAWIPIYGGTFLVVVDHLLCDIQIKTLPKVRIDLVFMDIFETCCGWTERSGEEDTERLDVKKIHPIAWQLDKSDCDYEKHKALFEEQKITIIDILKSIPRDEKYRLIDIDYWKPLSDPYAKDEHWRTKFDNELICWCNKE